MRHTPQVCWEHGRMNFILDVSPWGAAHMRICEIVIFSRPMGIVWSKSVVADAGDPMHEKG